MRQNEKRGDWLSSGLKWKRREKAKTPGSLCCCTSFPSMCFATSPGRETTALLFHRGARAAGTLSRCTWTVANREKGHISFHTITISCSHSLSTCTGLGMSSGLFKWCEGTPADKSWLHGGGSSGWGGKTHNATEVKSFTYVVIQGVVQVRRRTFKLAKSIRNIQQNLIQERYFNEMSLTLIAPILMETLHMLDIHCIQ